MTGSPVQTAEDLRVSGKLGDEVTDGLLITCSDRRFRRPVEHFMFKQLGLANYDVISVPGGAYMLSFADVLPKQLKVGMQMLKYLVKNHTPPRIVLMAHEGCSRYRQGFSSLLGRPNFSLGEKQKEDLRDLSAELAEMFPAARVEGYYAAIENGGTVRFERA